MSNNLIDFSFVYEMSDNDTEYVHEISSLFLKTVSEGLEKLMELVNTEDDNEVIRKQAHFLKSSANIIKVKGMYDELVKMEDMAREGAAKDKLAAETKLLTSMFIAARPELEAEIEKTKP
jgi:HPt (histidine-containing phosphotransfer) domain-containing protein